MVVLCVWVVGFLVRFFVLDQDQAHDASCCAECVSRTLEEVVVILRAVGRTMEPCAIYWASLAALRHMRMSLSLLGLMFVDAFAAIALASVADAVFASAVAVGRGRGVAPDVVVVDVVG